MSFTLAAQPVKDFFNLPPQANKKPFFREFKEHVGKNWTTLGAIAFAGIGRGINDDIVHKYNNTIFSTWKNQQWVNPEISWMNKCKKHPNPDIKCVPKFFGSTSFLAWTSDLNHFTLGMNAKGLQLGIVLYDKNGNFWIDAGFFTLGSLVYSGFAELARFVIRKRN